MAAAVAQVLVLCCVVCLSGSQVSQKEAPRPSQDDIGGVQDFLLTRHAVRKIRSTTNSGSRVLISLANMNLTDTRLSEFLIKFENSTNRTATSTAAQISVSLSGNQLTNLQSDYFASIKNLHELDVSQNRIESMDVRQSMLPHLEILNVSHNNLGGDSNTVLRMLPPRLQILDLSGNRINSTGGGGGGGGNVPSLQMLDLSCNELTTIDEHSFANVPTLRELDVSFNAITQLAAYTFAGLDALERLWLASNAITVIHNDTFLPLRMLQFLDVSNNDIQIGSIRALQGIPNLIGLSIANNEELSTSLQGFVTTWSLKELDGSGIGLCEIPAALTQSVKLLNLADNNLQIIRCGDLDSYPLLHKLVLSSNELRFIEDDALGRLEIITVLHLDTNRLDRIPISLPSSLIELHLEHNVITELHVNAVAHLRSLESLNLAGNPIIYLPGLPLPRLLHLSVRGCRLENVNQAVVKMSPHLKDIFLEDNPIKCADLLGIAEWATPCRVDNDGQQQPATSNQMATTTSSSASVAVMYGDNYVRQHGQRSCCAGRQLKTGKNRTRKRMCHVQHLFEAFDGTGGGGSGGSDETNSSVSDNVPTKTIHVPADAKERKKTSKKYDVTRKKYPTKAAKLRRGHAFEEHFDDIQHPFERRPPPPPPFPTPPPTNCSANTSAYTAEQWTDAATSNSEVTGHPGLFMVIGVTIGMITAFGLVHLYRRPLVCGKIVRHHRRRRRGHHHRYEINNYVAASPLNYDTGGRRQHNDDDLLHMDQLTTTRTTTNSPFQSTSTTSPIELW